jgi:hypothetical protein
VKKREGGGRRGKKGGRRGKKRIKGEREAEEEVGSGKKGKERE